MRFLIFLTAFAYAAIAILVVGSIYYLSSIEWIDHVEPLIASVSWTSILGFPVYHSIDSAERYSNLYGPFLYFFTGGWMKILGPSIFTAKLGSFIALLSSFAFFFFSLPQTLSFNRHIRFVGWLALIALSFAGNLFWIRPEPWMISATAFSLFAATRMGSWLAGGTWALCAVILVHLKLHAAIYALPSLAILLQREGLRSAMRAIMIAVALLPLPSLLIPNFSVQNLFLWIRITSQHGIEIRDVFKNLAWCVFYALPLLWNADLKSKARENRFFILALAVTFILGSISGALRGAGKYHILPPLLYLVWWGSTFSRENFNAAWKKAIAALSLLTLVWNAQRVSHVVWNELRQRDGILYIQELEMILTQYPNDWIQMGFGQDYGHTFYRTLLVFRQNRIFMDGATLMDFFPVQLEYTPATLEQIRNCQPSLWVMVKGDMPFDLRHVGSSSINVFRPEIQTLFLEHFEKTESTSHFDLWRCKPHHSQFSP